MAKLQKGFQDYFRIPILLKPVGQTPTASLTKIHQSLSSSNKPLILDQRYQPINSQHSKLLTKRDPAIPQNLCFRLSQFINEWSQFEVIYRCRFCVGVFDDCQGNLGQEWKKVCRVCTEENRKMVGLIILSVGNCQLGGIKQPSIIIPQKLEASQLYDFLQPWLLTILPAMQDYLCYLITQLLKDDNGFIVFNKAEQKPQPRTLKRKKKGRCLKICGDFSLNLHMVRQAYLYYNEAEELLKKVDDYLWLMGCNQGKMACFTTDVVLENIDKQQAIQLTRVQLLNLGKKIKVSQLQTQNYFKILKTYTKITQVFSDMSRDFLNYVMTNYSTSQKFSILTQLAFLYKQAGMIRKHNYVLFLSSRIAMELKPNLVGLILNQILQSRHIRQWPLVHANVIKLMIDNTNQPKNGQLHLALLQSCCSVLTQKDVEVTLQALQFKNFKQIKLENSQIISIISIVCVQSKIKPKINSISHEKESTMKSGFFMNWRKKQTIEKFQQQQKVIFQLKLFNNMNFPVHCSIKLNFKSPRQTKTNLHKFFLQPKLNKLHLSQLFTQIQPIITLQSISYKLFNFSYTKRINQLTHAPPTAIQLQIYEQYPDFHIEIPQIYRNQESSLFQFPLGIKRSKKYLGLAKIQLSICVYYTLQVGFQQTIHEITNIDHTNYLIVLSDYPYQTLSTPPPPTKPQLIKLHQLKLNKKYLKKIQIKIDAIRSPKSKYQISKKQSCMFVFERSIWCELISITTPMKRQFMRDEVGDGGGKGGRRSRIIQEKFVVRIAVNKKSDDLTPYKIVEKQGGQSYMLSQNTMIFIEKTLNKIKRKPKISPKLQPQPQPQASQPQQQQQQKNISPTTSPQNQPLSIILQWHNSTYQKQNGTIRYEIPFEETMCLSDKNIQFCVESWNGLNRQEIRCPGEIRVRYTVSMGNFVEQMQVGGCDLSHSFVVQPINLPLIKKYIVSGKTKIKYQQKEPNSISSVLNTKIGSNKQQKEPKKVQIKNQLKIKFYYEYKQQYMIGIRFEDGQVYWFPCVFCISQ